MASDSEISEDEFLPVKTKNNQFGPLGTRQASVRWFKETQSQSLRKGEEGFADWFHGIITRRYTQPLMNLIKYFTTELGMEFWVRVPLVHIYRFSLEFIILHL